MLTSLSTCCLFKFDFHLVITVACDLPICTCRPIANSPPKQCIHTAAKVTAQTCTLRGRTMIGQFTVQRLLRTTLQYSKRQCFGPSIQRCVNVSQMRGERWGDGQMAQVCADWQRHFIVVWQVKHESVQLINSVSKQLCLHGDVCVCWFSLNFSAY